MPTKNFAFAGAILFALAVTAPLSHAANTVPTPANSPAIPRTGPQSTFVLDPSLGKDPFFPKSKRLEVTPQKTNEAPVVWTPSFPDDVRCGGFSGTLDHRLAIVNNKTVQKGEKFELLLKSGRTQFHCIDVKEKSVVLEANGIVKELTLRPNF